MMTPVHLHRRTSPGGPYVRHLSGLYCRRQGGTLHYPPDPPTPLPVLQWAKWCVCRGISRGSIEWDGQGWGLDAPGVLPALAVPVAVPLAPIILPDPPAVGHKTCASGTKFVPDPPAEPEPTGPGVWLVSYTDSKGKPVVLDMPAPSAKDAKEMIQQMGGKSVKVQRK